MNEILEALDALRLSLEHLIIVLSEIQTRTESDSYTQDEALMDYENIMFCEGIDYISKLEDYIYKEPPPP